jgi:hypothetical protein
MIWLFFCFRYGEGGKRRVIAPNITPLDFQPPLRMDYQRVVIRKHPKTTEKQSPEGRFWRQFKNPVFIKDGAAVTSIHFTASKPHRYAVTSGARVQIYAPRTQKLVKTISRFKEVAHSGNIRADGKLLVAGDDSGLVQVSHLYLFIPSLIGRHRSLT